MYKKTLFIFRRDLRIEDNIGLIESLQNSKEVIPCFIYDENIIKKLKDSKFRWNFLNESLVDLDNELKKKGTSLQIKYTIEVHRLTLIYFYPNAIKIDLAQLLLIVACNMLLIL